MGYVFIFVLYNVKPFWKEPSVILVYHCFDYSDVVDFFPSVEREV